MEELRPSRGAVIRRRKVRERQARIEGLKEDFKALGLAIWWFAIIVTFIYSMTFILMIVVD